jgi:hypothetical protein
LKNIEVDLIAADKDGVKAHIEIARNKPGSSEQRKFESPEVIKGLSEVYGFDANLCRKIIVAWNAEETAIKTAKERGVEIWLLPELIKEIESHFREESGYYRDDAITTLHLAAKTASFQKRQEVKQEAKIPKPPGKPRGVPLEAWQLLISNIPKHVQNKTYKISEISSVLNYDLETEKSPIIHNAYWQGKHPHSDLWREAGWKAKPIRDKNTGKIAAVKFVNLAQGKFI